MLYRGTSGAVKWVRLSRGQTGTTWGMTTTWALQARCPGCAKPVLFACSREELTTSAGHRWLAALRITCAAGHQYDDHEAERILHGDAAVTPPVRVSTA